jgi:hypothetical protein
VDHSFDYDIDAVVIQTIQFPLSFQVSVAAFQCLLVEMPCSKPYAEIITAMHGGAKMLTTITTTQESYFVTDHARLRMEQRNLSAEDIAFILQHGSCLHRAGAIFYFLRRCDIPDDKQALDKYARLEGGTVVTSTHAPVIVTIYRNRRQGLRNIKRKVGHDCRPQAFSSANHNAQEWA